MAPSHTHGKSTARKAPPKAPLPVPERLKRLFTSLCAQIDGGHFHNAIKTCDKILRLSEGDPDALQTKLFLLLQTEQYVPALALLDSAGKEQEFERAYSLYRLQQEDAARAVLHGLKDTPGKVKPEQERGVLHLEAQLNYREGSYDAAFEMYNQLLDTAEPNSEEHTDILTNLHASQIHLEFINTSFQRAVSALPASLSGSLEGAAPPLPPSSSGPSSLPASTVPVPQTTTTATSSTPLTKPPRSSRLPAHVVPGVTPPPDPERWLKKTERSSFSVGRQKRKGGAGGATQGAAAVDVPVSSSAGGGGGGKKGKKRK